MIQISRKRFLWLAATSASAAALGCGEDASNGGNDNAAGGSGGTSDGTGGAGTSTGGSNTSTGGATGGGAGADGTGGFGGDPGSVVCDGETLTALCSDSGGHYHLLVIPVADILAGAGGTYQTSQGASDPGNNHCHQVTLTAQDMTTLQNGGVVKKTTCNGGDHEFVLSCAADPPAPVMPTTCGGSNDGQCM